MDANLEERTCATAVATFALCTNAAALVSCAWRWRTPVKAVKAACATARSTSFVNGTSKLTSSVAPAMQLSCASAAAPVMARMLLSLPACSSMLLQHLAFLVAASVLAGHDLDSDIASRPESSNSLLCIMEEAMRTTQRLIQVQQHVRKAVGSEGAGKFVKVQNCTLQLASTSQAALPKLR